MHVPCGPYFITKKGYAHNRCLAGMAKYDVEQESGESSHCSPSILLLVSTEAAGGWVAFNEEEVQAAETLSTTKFTPEVAALWEATQWSKQKEIYNVVCTEYNLVLTSLPQ
ncbi:hypothetical protein E2542_SST26779 [Spatholobus suberectus]|nr:hypothetical protein E2542_SST26779 [Spatholobus suberectus]